MRVSVICLLILTATGRAQPEQTTQERKDAERRARALSSLEKLGAVIVYDETPRKDGQPRKEIQRIELKGPDVTDETMAHVRFFPSLEVLHVCGTRVTDAGLELLTPLVNLQVLYLTYNRVTDEG